MRRRRELTPIDRIPGPVLSLLDAGSSSLGNVTAGVLAAQCLSTSEFGAFSTGILIALLGTGLSKALNADGLTLRYSASSINERRSAASLATGSALLTGLTLGAITYAASLMITAPDLSRTLACLALAFPGLTLQDSVRWASYVLDRPGIAWLNSVTWTILAVFTLSVLRVHSPSPATLILAWGFTALGGLAFGLARLGIRPKVTVGFAWLVEVRSISLGSSTDYSLTQASSQIATLIVGSIAGLPAMGLLRKAQLPVSGAQVLQAGMISYLQPTLVRLVAQGEWKRARKRTMVAAVGVAGVSILLGVLVLALPSSLMSGAIGPGWEQARLFVPMVAAQASAAGVSGAYGPLLRALGELNYQVRSKALVTPVIVVMVVVASYKFGVAGGTLALAVGAGALALIAEQRASRVISERVA